MSTFAVRFRRVRESKGLSLYAVAKATGLSKQGVINLELSDADPKLSTVEKLAAAFGVEPAELMGDQEATAAKSTAVDHDDGSASGAVDSLCRQVTPLLDELDEIGRMHEFMMSPVAVRIVAAKLRRLFGNDRTKPGRRKTDGKQYPATKPDKRPDPPGTRPDGATPPLSDGMAKANKVIKILRTISRDDRSRGKALRAVLDWINLNK